jgi:hypothetical protein
MAEKKIMYRYNFNGGDEFRPLKGTSLRDIEAADLMESTTPDRKAMRAVYEDKDGGVREYEGAGAGRGKQGGPTAKERGMKKGGKVAKYMRFSETGKPMGMAPVTKAKGGTASSRADGIAQKGKTRGTIVMCGGGMYKK